MTQSPTNDPRDLQERAYMIDDLGGMLASGDTTLAVVPSMFKRIMAEDAWLHFKTKFGNEVVYERTPADFQRFVETPPLDGLGTTLKHLRQLIAGDTIAIGLYEELVPTLPQGARTDLDPNLLYTIQQVPTPPSGTSADATMRRLRKHHPDLHERVMSGELSANAAAIEAGWRKRPLTISNPDDVDSIARTLRKHLDAQQLDDLVQRLTGK